MFLNIVGLIENKSIWGLSVVLYIYIYIYIERERERERERNKFLEKLDNLLVQAKFVLNTNTL